MKLVMWRGPEPRHITVATPWRRASVDSLWADGQSGDPAAAHGWDIARRLRELATDDHRSLVIVSHDDRLREIVDRVLWLDDGRYRELAAMTTDPVCGMAVETDSAYHLERAGRRHWFCSAHCRGRV